MQLQHLLLNQARLFLSLCFQPSSLRLRLGTQLLNFVQFGLEDPPPLLCLSLKPFLLGCLALQPLQLLSLSVQLLHLTEFSL